MFVLLGKARTQSRATEPSHRVQGRGQDKDKRRTRPGHRAGPQSPATELLYTRRTRGGQGPATELREFRGAVTRRTRGGQGPATEPSHRVDRVQGRGQEEDKAQPQSPATELTEFRGGQGPATEPSHGAQPQSSGARPVSVASSFLSKIEPQQ